MFKIRFQTLKNWGIKVKKLKDMWSFGWFLNLTNMASLLKENFQTFFDKKGDEDVIGWTLGLPRKL